MTDLILEQVMGIEPTQSAWRAEVLPLNYTCKVSGDSTGNRTRDPLIKSQMLYRLSYRVMQWLGWLGSNQRNDRVKVCCLTTWLHPNEWWRGADSNCRTRRELIYSQPRLATSLPLHLAICVQTYINERLQIIS